MRFRSIGGPYAISRWSVLLPLVLLVALRLADPTTMASKSPWVLVAATVAGMVAVGVAAIAVRATYLRPTGRGSRPAAALATFFALGCLRILGVAATEVLLGAPLSRPVLPELLIGGVQGAVVLALIAIWVDSQRQYRHSRDRLLAVRDHMRAARDIAEVRVEALLEALAADVAERVEQRWQASDDSTTESLAAASALRAVSEEYVRPLSHQIEREWLVDHLSALAGRGDTTRATSPTGRHDMLEVRDFFTALRAPDPYLVTGIILLLSTGTLLRVYGAMSTSLVLAATLPVMIVGGILVGRAMQRYQGHATAAAMALILGSLAVATAFVLIDAAVLAWTTGSAGWRLPTIGTYTFVAIMVSLGSTALALEDRAQEQLTTSILEDSQALDESNTHLAQLQAVTARFLHDSVQAELIAAALMLQRAPANDVDVRRELGDAYARINAAVELTGGQSLTPPSEPVRQQLDFWRDAAGVECTVDPCCWERLDERPAAAEALGGILSVAFTNAIRHGGRGQITVSLQPAPDEGVLVTVTNPGDLDEEPSSNPQPQSVQRAFGLEEIDSNSREWSLAGTGGVVTLRVVV